MWQQLSICKGLPHLFVINLPSMKQELVECALLGYR